MVDNHADRDEVVKTYKFTSILEECQVVELVPFLYYAMLKWLSWKADPKEVSTAFWIEYGGP